MFSFIISLLALVAGYFFYGAVVERIFGPDPSRPTPAASKADGVDFIKLPSWKVFMIQFLNIAGTGPIFGAIMGAKFGPASYLWIVLGCIFAGAVHDFLVGMLSVRNGGAGLPELVGKYLGKGTRAAVLVFSVVLLLLVGTVFVYSPALILGDIAGDGSRGAIMIWVGAIFLYYIVATLLPIDKLIGKIYPLFAFALLFMAMALMVGLFIKWPSIPEFWDGLYNRGPEVGLKDQPIFPCLFITIACGAISGFHATQSPLMARCINSEKHGRPIFYGAMITEGLVALVWAAVSSYFFFDGGAVECGSDLSAAAPTVVTKVSESWLGIAGGILAILGVVAAPITSGDTAFRSSRLIIADFLKVGQKKIAKRLIIAIPMFLAASLLLWFNVAKEDGFNIIWRYFGWANQTLAVFALWTATAWLSREKKGAGYLIAFLPACFMTAVCVAYILTAKIGFNLPTAWNLPIGAATFAVSFATFYILRAAASRKQKARGAQITD
ncbi:MAG: carbon starvation protein A [Bacteroidales bacterium]|nr:carbon starvation protein A [Bacteroidales bacterium]